MELNIANLFCGMGGDELGIRDAVYSDLRMTYKGLSINHWDRAVDTMRANFQNVRTIDCKIEEAVPGELIPWGTEVHLLWASPSCTHHSRAKGGRPRSNQLRSQPEYVTTWVSQTRPWCVIVENVPEFREWGPLDEKGQPIKERKGETFSAWVKMIESLGYNVEHRVLCCADYGDATTRKRFFLIAVRNDIGTPVWPERTYGNHVSGLPQWRGACECLDLSNLGRSIFGRKRPLSNKTLDRLAKGAQKYWGLDITTDMLVKACGRKRALKPFIVKLNRGATVEDVDDPLTTVMAGGNHHALVQAKPYIVRIDRSTSVEDIDHPVSTILAGGRHHALVQAKPFIAKMRSHATTAEIDEPLTTISAGGIHHAVCSLVCDHQNHGQTSTIDKPIKTISTHDHFSLATLVLGQHGAAACRPATEPVPTIACKGAVRAIEPIVIDNANGGTIRGSGEPINTITLKDQHMMALPVLEDGRRIDIYMRMLTPRELAKAHSVPDDFVIKGNKTEQIKQIGNSVPVRTSRALVKTLLGKYIKKERAR